MPIHKLEITGKRKKVIYWNQKNSK